MALKMKATVLGSVQAASLACHASAGLLTTVKKDKKVTVSAVALAESSRLLRSAEALARSAYCLLSNSFDSGGKNMVPGSSHNVNGAMPDETPQLHGERTAQKESRAVRRRKNRQAKKNVQSSSEGMVVDSVAQGGGLPNTLEVLQDLTKNLHTIFPPPPATGSSAAAADEGKVFLTGSHVLIEGLSNRTELNGTAAVVIDDTTQNRSDTRYAVKTYAGETVRVQPANLRHLPQQASYPDAPMWGLEPKY